MDIDLFVAAQVNRFQVVMYLGLITLTYNALCRWGSEKKPPQAPKPDYKRPAVNKQVSKDDQGSEGTCTCAQSYLLLMPIYLVVRCCEVHKCTCTIVTK